MIGPQVMPSKMPEELCRERKDRVAIYEEVDFVVLRSGKWKIRMAPKGMSSAFTWRSIQLHLEINTTSQM